MVADERTAPAAAAAPYAGHGTKPYRAYVLGVLMVIYAVNLLDRGLVGLLQEKFKPEFHLSDFELGLLGGPAFALCNALAGLPLARLAERFNRIGVLSICVALWSVMTACCGLAVSFPMLLLARFGVGIGEAGCLPPTQSVIAVMTLQRATQIDSADAVEPLGAASALLRTTASRRGSKS